MLSSSAWKIAPGNRANDWDLFRNHHCIGIGWLPYDYDYNDFEDAHDVLATLEAEHGVGTSGYGKGSAEMVWSFTHELRVGDIVVANRAYNEVVGIGLIASDYLPPMSKKNPIRDDETTHRHHVRLVNWLITKPAKIPGSRFFVQRTLGPLDAAQFSQIKRAYLRKYPTDSSMKRQFAKLLACLQNVTRD